MLRKEKNGVEWLEFELFEGCKELKHGIFLKHGGVSQGPFQSLNFGLTQGDDPTHVEENKKKTLQTIDLSHTASTLQVHGSDIIDINSNRLEQDSSCADGMITQEQDLGLLIKHADCQAAIFYDPCHHALGVIHCGWRGNVQNIYANALLRMKNRFGTKPADVLVGISPSLGPYASEFRFFANELPVSFWQFQVKPTYFDLWAISRWQLEMAGVLPHHIQIAKLCTFQVEKDFFSYRREKKSGRHATIAALL